MSSGWCGTLESLVDGACSDGGRSTGSGALLILQKVEKTVKTVDQTVNRVNKTVHQVQMTKNKILGTNTISNNTNSKPTASPGTSSSSSSQTIKNKNEISQMTQELDQQVNNDGVNIPLSTCDGNKKALLIGINYYGTNAELRGCINDVHNIQKFVTRKFQFPTDAQHMRILTDDKNNAAAQQRPTRSNIIAGMKWLVQDARPGDSLFLHYSGHGGSQKDTDGDEADGMDETLIPVDYESAGVIVDDEIHALLVAPLPAGVRLTAIMDCCHSGSVLDLPFTYSPNGNLEIQEVDNRKAVLEAALQAGKLLLKGDKVGALMGGAKALALYVQNPNGSNNGNNNANQEKLIQIRSAVADVIQFSGCRDEQTSADANIGGQATGAMSWSLIEAFERHGMNQTYTQLLGNIRKILHGKYTQVPQMSTGHKMDMKTTFKM